MPKYCVLVKGQNYLINLTGKVEKSGFYVNRFVEADDEVQAESIACDMIHNDPELSKMMLNGDDDKPTVRVVETREIAELQSQHGFSFYREQEGLLDGLRDWLSALLNPKRTDRS
jgi:hypothetical protein